MTPANGGLKYPRSRGAWQIRLKHRQANGEITAPLFSLFLSLWKSSGLSRRGNISKPDTTGRACIFRMQARPVHVVLNQQQI